MTTGTRRALTALGATATLLIGACSSDDTDAADADTAPVDGVVKIGVIAPIEDGLTEFGQAIANSAQLAADQANDSDMIPGWTIELEIVDDSSDPDIGEEAASQLIEDPAVLGVVGPYNSGVAEAILPATDDADLVVISPGNTLAELTRGSDPDAPERQYDTYSRLVATDAEQAPFLAENAYNELEVREVAVVSETKAVSADLADAFAEAFTDLGGEVLVQSSVPDETDEFSEFLDEALPTEPELIFVGGEYPVAAALSQQAAEAGFEGPVMGGDGIKDPAYITDAGEASIGDYASTVGAPADELDSAAQFIEDYEEAGFEEPPSDFGVYAYDAANVLITALAEVLADQDSIPSDARAQMAPLVDATEQDGASGPISFNEFGDTQHQVFTLFQVSDQGDDPAWAVVVTTTL